MSTQWEEDEGDVQWQVAVGGVPHQGKKVEGKSQRTDEIANALLVEGICSHQLWRLSSRKDVAKSPQATTTGWVLICCQDIQQSLRNVTKRRMLWESDQRLGLPKREAGGGWRGTSYFPKEDRR